MSELRTLVVIAHRGASADHAENTIAAFRGALDQGADWVELDVRGTVDGGLVVHHDPLYGDGRIVATTPADDRPDSVPDLVEALDACAGMGVNVEIKNSPGDLGPDVSHDLHVADLVLDVLAQRRISAPGQQILVTSFDEPTLSRVRAADRSPDTGLLTFDAADASVLDRCAAAGDVAVNPWEHLVDEVLMSRCTTLGLRVNTWTVDDPDRMRHLAGLGVHGIITNVPGLARAALGLDA